MKLNVIFWGIYRLGAYNSDWVKSIGFMPSNYAPDEILYDMFLPLINWLKKNPIVGMFASENNMEVILKINFIRFIFLAGWQIKSLFMISQFLPLVNNIK